MVDTVLSLGPARLEVHNAADAGAAVGESDRVPVLTRYLPRAHDRRVRAVLGEVLAGGPSRLVMLTGESSTGKTRALYEALLDLAPSAPLLHPVGDLDLLELLDEGRVRSGCVVWLNEAQRFLYNRDAAARLRAVMTATPGIAAVGTLWNNPYWNDLTTSDNSDGPRSQAKALLTHPALAVRINVPAHLDAEDLNGWRKLARTSGDPRLQQALSAGAGDGKVIQYVSGGPELLTAYLTGDRGGALFTAAEHALITVALDARRLGHRGPLPAALLTDAADGSLSTRDRSPDPRWAEHALRALSSGRREDGSRADVRNTLTALTAVYARSGAPAAYEPADYLDQHARRLRAEQYGTPALWNALIEHTIDPFDMDNLAHAAWDRGLRTTAIRLWHKAVTAGYPTDGLIDLDDVLDPGEQAATYTAVQVGLNHTESVRRLLGRLRSAEANAAFSILAGRACAHADIADPWAVSWLLRTLRENGAHEAAKALVDRDVVADADLTDPAAAGFLLKELLSAIAKEASQEVARRGASDADLKHLFSTAGLIKTLAEAGAGREAAELAERAAAEADLSDPSAVARLLAAIRMKGTRRAQEVLLNRAPADHAIIGPLSGTKELLHQLKAAEAEHAFTVLLHRAVNETDLTSPATAKNLLQSVREADAEQAIAELTDRILTETDFTDYHRDEAPELLREVRWSGADHVLATLAQRAAAEVDLTDPARVARLLDELATFEAERAVRILLERDPVAHVSLADRVDPFLVTWLLSALRRSGAEQAARTLVERAVAEADFSDSFMMSISYRALRHTGAGEQAGRLFIERAARADLTDPNTASCFLDVLRAIGSEEAIAALLARFPVAEVDAADPGTLARLFDLLTAAGAGKAVATLTERALAETDLTSPPSVAYLLETLHNIGAGRAVAVLAERAASRADVDNRPGVVRLLDALRKVKAGKAAARYEARARDAGHFPHDFVPYGREPDGRPSRPWTVGTVVALNKPPDPAQTSASERPVTYDEANN
ncbi:hypothetical protein [Catenulispora yoronensis]